MSDKPRVAVIGGGLGGTVAAIFLQRAGIPVKVYEQAPKLARIGAGINLGPHVMRIMRRIGIEETMTSIGVLPHERLRRVWDTGQITLRQPVENFTEMYGANHLIIHRGDFQAILTSRLQPGTLELSKCLVDVNDGATSAKINFTDGTSAEADIVIGADGINSKVHEALYGNDPPLYADSVAYRSIFPIELLKGMHVPDHTKWFKDENHILIYFITRAREVIYFVTGNPEPWGSDNFSPQVADLKHLREAFSGFHSEVQDVLSACPAASRWPILERLPRAGWSRGRIVLLGDACHAMRPHMGQGAAMAIEDAVVLARCIAEAGSGPVAETFRLYEALRYDRATRVQSSSRHSMWLKDDKEDPGWLYSHDVLNLPLTMPAGAAAMTAGA